MQKDKHIIISLGGSLIVPDAIDSVFVSDFVSLVKDYVNQGFKFMIITGGGRVARNYNVALREIAQPTNTDLDWLGIAATRLNSEFVRIAFGDMAYDKVVLDPDVIPSTDKPVILSAGWKPGNSSDLAAVHAAASLGAVRVINLSNIDYSYDKDPKVHDDAKPIHECTWPEFRKILPPSWDPGLNAPFDPVAAAKAESLGLEVVIMNGKNIENIKKYLNGEEFVGSVIR